MRDSASFRLRVRYGKRGRLKYLGHLEVLHTVERIVRRAGLPYAVTQGFSPHMKMGFSAALPVGTSSNCEWYDLFMTEQVPLEDAMGRLRAASPADLAPVEVAYIDVRSPALTAFITRMDYEVRLYAAAGDNLDVSDVASRLDELRSMHSIPYQRGKKSKQLDLDRTLLSYELQRDGDSLLLSLATHADNDGSMRPEILLSALDRLLQSRGDFEDDPIVSTGIQDLCLFPRYDVERIRQVGEDDEGAPRYPIPLR